MQRPAVAGELPLGGVSVAVVVGRESEQPPQEGAEPRKVSVTYDKEQERIHVTLNIGFSMDLSVGTRSGGGMQGKGPDMIAPIPCSVHTG